MRAGTVTDDELAPEQHTESPFATLSHLGRGPVGDAGKSARHAGTARQVVLYVLEVGRLAGRRLRRVEVPVTAPGLSCEQGWLHQRCQLTRAQFKLVQAQAQKGSSGRSPGGERQAEWYRGGLALRLRCTGVVCRDEGLFSYPEGLACLALVAGVTAALAVAATLAVTTSEAATTAYEATRRGRL
ncbi:MAG: hypothetical protein IMX01_08320 [Limnochordaceae bacterium]|nr:hypothetical protein [Limnochordaceae bacterium]